MYYAMYLMQILTCGFWFSISTLIAFLLFRPRACTRKRRAPPLHLRIPVSEDEVSAHTSSKTVDEQPKIIESSNVCHNSKADKHASSPCATKCMCVLILLIVAMACVMGFKIAK